MAMMHRPEQKLPQHCQRLFPTTQTLPMVPSQAMHAGRSSGYPLDCPQEIPKVALKSLFNESMAC